MKQETNGIHRAKYAPVSTTRHNQQQTAGKSRSGITSQVDKYIDSTTTSSEEVPKGNADVGRKDLKQQIHQSSVRDQDHWHQNEQHIGNNTLVTLPPVDYNIDKEDEEHDQLRRIDVDLNELNERKIESQLEEVYLCNCCGFTRELKPAMAHLSSFKSLFYLFNFISFAFAFALLGFGLWYRIDPKVYELHNYIETQNFTIAGWIMLFGGFSVCLLTLLGCRATNKLSMGTLLFYCICVTCITLAFIATLVLLTVHGLGSTLERFMSKEVYDQIRRRAMSTSEEDFPMTGRDATQFLDFVQVKLRCCGSHDFRDYQKLGMVIPATCYTIAGNYINAPGCARAIRQMFDLRAGLASGFTAVSVVAQILSTLFAALIVCSVYNDRANSRLILADSGGEAIANTNTTYIKTPQPGQFSTGAERQPVHISTRSRDYQSRHSRPSSRSSVASIRV